jgi:type 1 glutamine amidotransferase
MKNILVLFFSLVIAVIFSGCLSVKKDINVLLITGGHSFDTTEFFNLFFSFEGISLDTISQPHANEFLGSDQGKSYDVYVFYDMWREISEDHKDAYIKLTKLGKGLLFLHHSIVSAQNWDSFKEIVGGKYHEARFQPDTSLRSDYAHDLDLNIRVANPEHPVTLGMADFQIHDEGYGKLELMPGITPLLTTVHPECNEIVGWTNTHANSQIVYLIFGHDKKAYEDEDFRILLRNSINWLKEITTDQPSIRN